MVLVLMRVGGGIGHHLLRAAEESLVLLLTEMPPLGAVAISILTGAADGQCVLLVALLVLQRRDGVPIICDGRHDQPTALALRRVSHSTTTNGGRTRDPAGDVASGAHSARCCG